jgi:hypothetical protein
MKHCVVTLELADVSEVRTASIIRAMMEAVRTSEMSVNFNVSTLRYILENYKFQQNYVLKYLYNRPKTWIKKSVTCSIVV